MKPEKILHSKPSYFFEISRGALQSPLMTFLGVPLTYPPIEFGVKYMKTRKYINNNAKLDTV